MFPPLILGTTVSIAVTFKYEEVLLLHSSKRLFVINVKDVFSNSIFYMSARLPHILFFTFFTSNLLVKNIS